MPKFKVHYSKWQGFSQAVVKSSFQYSGLIIVCFDLCIVLEVQLLTVAVAITVDQVLFVML